MLAVDGVSTDLEYRITRVAITTFLELALVFYREFILVRCPQPSKSSGYSRQRQSRPVDKM